MTAGTEVKDAPWAITYRTGSFVPAAGARMQYGGSLSDYRVEYSLAGPPSAPVVAVLGGISADRHVTSTADRTGWWDTMVGPDRPVDLRAYRVLSIDWLGGPGDSIRLPARPRGAQGTTAPEVGASTGRDGAGGDDSRLITPRDQADALASIVRGLDLGRLHGLIGASYGGAVAIAFAAAHARLTRGALVIGATHRSHALATAVRSIQREIVRRSVRTGDAAAGLALSRALALTTYGSDRQWDRRFAGGALLDGVTPRFPVERFLNGAGRTFAARWNAEQFLCLSQSLDLHAVEAASIRAPLTLVSIEPDFVAPRWQVEQLASEIEGPCSVVRIDSEHGHDAFLTDTDVVAPAVAEFLSNPELD